MTDACAVAAASVAQMTEIAVLLKDSKSLKRTCASMGILSVIQCKNLCPSIRRKKQEMDAKASCKTVFGISAAKPKTKVEAPFPKLWREFLNCLSKFAASPT